MDGYSGLHGTQVGVNELAGSGIIRPRWRLFLLEPVRSGGGLWLVGVIDGSGPSRVVRVEGPVRRRHETVRVAILAFRSSCRPWSYGAAGFVFVMSRVRHGHDDVPLIVVPRSYCRNTSISPSLPDDTCHVGPVGDAIGREC